MSVSLNYNLSQYQLLLSNKHWLVSAVVVSLAGTRTNNDFGVLRWSGVANTVTPPLTSIAYVNMLGQFRNS